MNNQPGFMTNSLSSPFSKPCFYTLTSHISLFYPIICHLCHDIYIYFFRKPNLGNLIGAIKTTDIPAQKTQHRNVNLNAAS